MVLDGDYIE